jgi:hypothetical protein
MTPIYHITHVANLPAILREGGLLGDAEAERRRVCAQSIAYDTIKERRRRRIVANLRGEAVGAGGILPDYVPFYFCNRSPMLGAIHKGNVPGYQGGQRQVVYLVSSVEKVAAVAGLRWCFTDGHAVEAVTDFFDRLEDLTKVDRVAVETWRWGGKWLLNDPDVKRRKQAEFLVHGRFPWGLVTQLGVFDTAMAADVQNSIAGTGQLPRVTIERKWYYDS